MQLESPPSADTAAHHPAIDGPSSPPRTRSSVAGRTVHGRATDHADSRYSMSWTRLFRGGKGKQGLTQDKSTNTIVVAAVGAGATIIAAIITALATTHSGPFAQRGPDPVSPSVTTPSPNYIHGTIRMDYSNPACTNSPDCWVYLLSSPNLSASAVGYLTDGAQIQIVCSTQGGSETEFKHTSTVWYKVKYNGQGVYVNSVNAYTESAVPSC
jgi:hypothetical protein